MRLLAILSDAYGGRGGIARFNRDLLEALCTYPAMEEMVAYPRVVPDPPEAMPAKLDYCTEAAGGMKAFLQAVGREVWSGRYDGVICGHIHLLPFAFAAARRGRVPLLLIIHGLEARDPSAQWLANQLVNTVDAFVSVSHFTKRRFVDWSGVDAAKGHVVPNCIDRSQFGEGLVPSYLEKRYGLEGRTILFTLGRLPDQELKKGHDEVLEVLPDLAREIPDIAYLIAGDGPDRSRLEQKAETLGVADRVVFAGYIPEEEKADHYRLADAFVMPGRTEGFGIVYLEALACGVPVVASSADASREAVRDGQLGVIVDPDDDASIKAGIREALARPRGVPDGLDAFSTERFTERWHRVIEECF